MIDQSGSIWHGTIQLSYSAMLPETPQLALILIHGLSEHKGRYRALQKTLAEAGHAVYAYDQRGFGQSGGVRTHVERYADYFLDLKEVIAFVRVRHPGLKIILIGHSLGGLVSATFCVEFPDEVEGLILSAPAYDVFPLPRLLEGMARLMNHLLPNRPIRYVSAPEKLSHDPEVVAAFRRDPLVQSAATPRFYAEFCKMNRVLHQKAGQIQRPTLILQGSADTLVRPQGARALFHQIQSREKQIRWYEGFLHEPFNEIGRERVIADVIGWLKSCFP